MKESSFWDYLRGQLPAGIHYSRIESETSPGFPDVFYTLDGVSGTIELKSTKRPRAKFPFSGKDGLRKSQLDWIAAETEAGGKVLLALECGPAVYIIDDSGGIYAPELHRMTLEDIGRVAWDAWVKGDSPPQLDATLVNKD